MSDVRRFQLSVLASVIVNGLAFLLAAHFWNLAPLPFLPAPPRIKLVQIALTPPKPVPVVKTQPIPAAVPKPHQVKRPTPQKPRRPGERVKSSSPAPAAKPAGGSDAGAAAPAQAAPPPIPVVTTERPSPRVAQAIQAPPPPVEIPLPSFTPSRVIAPPILHVAPVVLKPAHGASGTDTTGKGKGAGEGVGTNIGTGAGTSRDAGEPFGIGKGMAGDGGPRHVVYVLDISGSMTSRISRADEEIRKALTDLRPDETFDIIAFSDDVSSFDTGMAPATPTLVRQASAYLDTLQVDGGTNLEAAMTRALSLPNVNDVVLITDGVPTLGEQDFDKLAILIRQRNQTHARIFTVGLVGKNPDGTDQSFEAANLLQTIARESGGSSKLVPLGVASP